MHILIINGPNLNMLGVREPHVYGSQNYSDLEQFCQQLASIHHCKISSFQSNHEGAIVDRIQQARIQKIDGLIINPGALTHYSYAIYDALLMVEIPIVEVHLTDLTTREAWRQISVIRPACQALFMGEHFISYQKAIEFILGVTK